MKRNTIKWKIFKYNIMVIISFILFSTVVFNLAVRVYMERDMTKQLKKIAARTEDALIHKGPDYLKGQNDMNPPPRPDGLPPDGILHTTTGAAVNLDSSNLIRFYFMLDRSLKEPLSVLNANYILVDNKENVITPPQEFSTISDTLMSKIKEEFNSEKSEGVEKNIRFVSEGADYIAILKPVADKNSFGLGWIMIYSSLEKINQLQVMVNLILLVILLVSAVVAALLSSLAAKRISEPFSTLSEHIGEIAERNFGNKLQVDVDDELKEFVSSVNMMSEKLEQYDKAQKTFLQNASHEFRTPLMSIQSYAEGIKYNVVESDTAADIILDETRRMTNLVTDLLYLSRLEAIEESYNYNRIDIMDMLRSCKYRSDAIAAKSNIEIVLEADIREMDAVIINADEEKLSRALTNIINNCIRYARSRITISLECKDSSRASIVISDDGCGFREDELPHIFDRFYKGAKGNYGLGLAITKNIIDKHNGSISAYNSESGAVFEIVLPR